MNRGFHIYSGFFEFSKNHRRCQAADFWGHFLSYSAIMTRIKAHADDYNIVCEVLHNDNDRLHAFIA